MKFDAHLMTLFKFKKKKKKTRSPDYGQNTEKLKIIFFENFASDVFWARSPISEWISGAWADTIQ